MGNSGLMGMSQVKGGQSQVPPSNMAESTIIKAGDHGGDGLGGSKKGKSNLRPVETPGYSDQPIPSSPIRGADEVVYTDAPKNFGGGRDHEDEGGKSESFVLQIPQITKVKK